jgi:general secretion pathway protein K
VYLPCVQQLRKVLRAVDKRIHTQQGAAIITALLVVMLAATIASYLLAQQSAALTRTERATARAQLTLYAQPTLDYARVALTDALKNANYVHNKQPWAQGLKAQPIGDAIAAGTVRDEGAKFNLNNLVQDDGTASAADVEIFSRLLKNLSLEPTLSAALVDWIDKDSETSPNGAEDGFYLSLAAPYRTANRRLLQLDELSRVRGFNAQALRKITPYVTALPKRTKININTALPEVLSAAFPILSNDDITTLVRAREELPMKDLAEMKSRAELKKIPPASLDQFADVNSGYFSVLISITRESAQLSQTALLSRPSSTSGTANNANSPAIIWVKTQ